MISIDEVAGKDIWAMFPGNARAFCSVGYPVGPGLRLGYKGWGEPDIALDPAMPLDACIRRLGLEGTFERVQSTGLMNRVHGDCVATHAGKGLANLLTRRGELSVSALSTSLLAKDALNNLDGGAFTKCQRLEKFCFKQPDDASGLLYQQTFLNEERVISMFPSLEPEITKRAETTLISCPEDIRLGGIDDKSWARGKTNNGLQSSLSHDWPNCIACGRLATKMDHNRACYSRYCKDHYHAARAECDRKIIESYTMKFVFRKS